MLWFNLFTKEILQAKAFSMSDNFLFYDSIEKIK